MTIEHLPGTRLSPKVLLARLLEDADDLEEVVVVYTRRDRVVQCTWSDANTIRLIGMATLLQTQLMDVARDALDELTDAV